MSPLYRRALSAPHPPVWFMRQAGRYLPEYQEVRKTSGSFWNLCFTPELATEVTLQPIRRFDLDAAILFADILVIPHALGQQVDFIEGTGPVLGTIPDMSGEIDFSEIPKKLSAILETLKQTRSILDPQKSLIGFAGAPWTVATYMLQGTGIPREKVKIWALEHPTEFKRLLEVITEATLHYLLAQIAAGADTLQIFESWGGLVPASHYETFLIEPVRRLVRGVGHLYPQIPVIGYARGIADYAQYAKDLGLLIMGVDERADLTRLEDVQVLQGNLDVGSLVLGGEPLKREVERLVTSMRGRPYIFNLGHGIVPETPPQHVADVVSWIRAEDWI